MPNYFLEVFGALPRAGPGSDELTRRAFEMIPSLPPAPRILDVGCGPGRQTVELLRLCEGTVVALDFLPEMIERTKEEADSAGVRDRLETLLQDMREMTFPESSFDVVWSEGAIYNLGFEAGLREFSRFVRPGGHLAVSEAVWLKPDPPRQAVDFWQDYPEIDSVDAKLEVIAQVGFKSIGHFVFPPSAWTNEYYDPMDERVAEKAQEWVGISEAQEVLTAAKEEIRIFREYSEYFSYAFFVMQA